MKGLLGRAKHVHVESHTTFGDGGGGVFDVKPVGSYVDNNVTVLVNGTAAGIRRTDGSGRLRVQWGGADKTGATDVSAAVASVFAAGKSVDFDDDGTYLFLADVTLLSDNIDINFGRANIVNGGLQYVFSIGDYGQTYGSTYRYTGLKIRGGRFTQSDPLTTADTNYIIVRATRNFEISGCELFNVGAAGIQIQVGCRDGSIHHIRVEGNTAFDDPIGIVLSGTNAIDYGDGVYVDWETCERNAQPLPIYGVENVSVSECNLRFDVGYGVYAHNTRNCGVYNSTIDLGSGTKRGIAVHNYSPGFKIIGNTIKSSYTASGIIVTQCATGVVISGNVFKGNFGVFRTIVVSTMAQALISNNTFEDETHQHIYICTNGFAHVSGNTFVRSTVTPGDRAVWVTAVDRTQPTNLAVGKLAGTLQNSGVVFENNTLINLAIGVCAEAHYTSDNGNQPGIGIVKCTNNTFLGMDQSDVSDYPMVVRAGDGANITHLRYEKNTVLPYTSSDKNMALVEAGTAYLYESSDAQIALFSVSVPASGGAIVTKKLAGENFALSVVRSSDDLVFSPRTQNGVLGGWGPVTPVVSSVIDASGATAIHRSSCIQSGLDYTVKLFDSTDTQIALSTAAVELRALLGPIALGWTEYTYDRYLFDLADAVGGLANIKFLFLAEDLTGSVGDPVITITPRIGSAFTSYTSERAVVGSVHGYRCLHMANAVDKCVYYSAQGAGTRSHSLLAQYNGTLPATEREFLIHDPNVDGSLFIPAAGVSYWSSTTVAPVYTDLERNNYIPDTTHAHTITRAASQTTAGPILLGGYSDGSATDNFKGDLWQYMITTNALTLAQAKSLYAVNKRYYKFLGAS
jgi:hypothetical protein